MRCHYLLHTNYQRYKHSRLLRNPQDQRALPPFHLPLLLAMQLPRPRKKQRRFFLPLRRLQTFRHLQTFRRLRTFRHLRTFRRHHSYRVLHSCRALRSLRLRARYYHRLSTSRRMPKMHPTYMPRLNRIIMLLICFS